MGIFPATIRMGSKIDPISVESPMNITGIMAWDPQKKTILPWKICPLPFGYLWNKGPPEIDDFPWRHVK